MSRRELYEVINLHDEINRLKAEVERLTERLRIAAQDRADARLRAEKAEADLAEAREWMQGKKGIEEFYAEREAKNKALADLAAEREQVQFWHDKAIENDRGWLAEREQREKLEAFARTVEADNTAGSGSAPLSDTGRLLMYREQARRLLFYLREALRPAAPCATFEPCREGDEGDDPAHNFTCALLCINCGLTHEKHVTPDPTPSEKPGWRWESPRWIPTHIYEHNAFVHGCAHVGPDGFHCREPKEAHPEPPDPTPSEETGCYCTGDGHKKDCAFWLSLSGD